MTTYTRDQMRKAFEADFIGDHTSAPHTLDRSGDGYRFMVANEQWTTWKRAWASYPAPMSKENMVKVLEALQQAGIPAHLDVSAKGKANYSVLREAITIMQSAIEGMK
jgi:hypothetical protein